MLRAPLFLKDNRDPARRLDAPELFMTDEQFGRTALRSSAVLALALVCTSCRLLMACDYEVRSTSSTGILSEDAGEIVRVEASASERRGSSHDRAFSWLVVSPALSGHVKSVNLVQASQPEVVLLRLASFESETSPTAAFGGYLEERAGVIDQPMTGIFEIIAGNRGILEITTDLASRPVVRLPLTVREKRDWYRPNCDGWDDPSLKH